MRTNLSKRFRALFSVSTLKYLCFAGVLLILTGLLVEIILLVLEPYIFKGLYQYDPDLGFRVRPVPGKTNRFGFNDRDYPPERTPNTFRILVVGDSFNWAGGIEGNYVSLLEKKFETYYGDQRVEIINSGYLMTHTGEQLAMLKKYGLHYQPDLVFLGFYCGNDFIDADPYRKRIMYYDIYFDIDRRHEWTLFGYPFLGQSILWYLTKQRLILFRESIRRRLDRKTAQPEPAQPEPARSKSVKETYCTFSKTTYFQLEKAKLDFCHVASYEKGVYDDRITYIFESISQMQSLLTQKGVQFMVGMYPNEFQVDKQLLQELIEYFKVDPKHYDFECMQRILKAHLTSKGIPYLDLLEAFREQGKITPLYRCRDTHWNEAGNTLAAETIFQFLLPVVDK